MSSALLAAAASLSALPLPGTPTPAALPPAPQATPLPALPAADAAREAGFDVPATWPRQHPAAFTRVALSLACVPRGADAGTRAHAHDRLETDRTAATLAAVAVPELVVAAVYADEPTGLALHPTLTADAIVGRTESTTTVNVTHIESGLAVARDLPRPLALALMAALRDAAPAGSWTRPWTALLEDRDFRAAMHELITDAYILADEAREAAAASQHAAPAAEAGQGEGQEEQPEG